LAAHVTRTSTSFYAGEERFEVSIQLGARAVLHMHLFWIGILQELLETGHFNNSESLNDTLKENNNDEALFHTKFLPLNSLSLSFCVCVCVCVYNQQSSYSEQMYVFINPNSFITPTTGKYQLKLIESKIRPPSRLCIFSVTESSCSIREISSREDNI